jgi:hypothetical protein
MNMNKRKKELHRIAYTQVFKETMVRVQFLEIQETQDTLRFFKTSEMLTKYTLPFPHPTAASENVELKDTVETCQLEGNQQIGSTIGDKGWPVNLTLTNPVTDGASFVIPAYNVEESAKIMP